LGNAAHNENAQPGNTPADTPAAPQYFLQTNRTRVVGGLLAVVFVAIAAVGYYWYVYLERFVGTDDAYIEADLFPVNSRIMGYMKDVNAEEGDTVRKGQVLASIDDADIDFELNYKKMKLQKAQTDLKRARQLHDSRAISEFDLENAEANYKANLTDLQGSEIKLRYTKVLSPSDGVVAKRSVQPGQFVQPGQVLVVVVDNRRPWIKANFKETQIEHLKPGQDVRIWLDSYPNARVKGKVETIFPSSGAKLSILPPENATGNFTRIVQRIPVKISVEPQEKIYLRPGMSVQVSVDTDAAIESSKSP
jgi:membrane fusion protein (multidrug efflux system)